MFLGDCLLYWEHRWRHASRDVRGMWTGEVCNFLDRRVQILLLHLAGQGLNHSMDATSHTALKLV